MTIPGCRSIGHPGEPVLPVFPVCFMIPPGETVTRVTYETAGETALDGSYAIAPMQLQAPVDAPGAPAFVRSAALYGSSQAFPKERAVLATEQTLAGVRLAFVDVYPCTYVPSSGTVSFSPSIRVVVETAPSSRPAARAPAEMMRRAIRAMRSRVANPELSVDYETRAAALVDTTPPAELVHYVIITSPSFVTAFQPLADLKTRCGMRTRIVDTEWISSNFGGADTQEKIRNFIIYAYQNWHTQYVLLGGDNDIIPHRGFYVKNGTYIDADIPSDLYYSCLDGNWNGDGDAYFGEPGEEDLLPEVIVGRLPVDSAVEIANAIDKITRYTLSPVESQCTSAAMLGELLWSSGGVDTWGGDYKNEVLHGSSNWGFTTAGLPALFATTTLYDGPAGSWNKSQLIALLNGGVNLVNHCGHSSLYSVMRLATGDIPLLTNDGVSASFFIAYSHGCYVAAFDNRDEAGTVHTDDCIGEQLVNGPHGAVAFIGNTRYGWDAPGSTCGVSQFFDRRFFDAIFGQGITRLGDALEDSRIDNIPYISFDAVRWVYYDLCLFGDPAMSVWTQTPLAIAASHDSVLFAGPNGFEVRVSDAEGPVPGALACLSSTAPDLYCAATTDASGVALLEPSPTGVGKVLLSIVSPNHYPRVDTLLVEQRGAFLPSLAVNAVHDDPPAGSGDGDGIAEPGEIVALTVELRNAGLNSLDNIRVSLATSDTTLIVRTDSASAGYLPPGASVILDRAFSVEVKRTAKSNRVAALDFHITSAEGSWKALEPLTVNAPDVVLDSWTISDAPHGDGNGCLDAWEFENLTCAYRNRGATDVIKPVLTLSFPDNSWGRAIKATSSAPVIPAGGTLTMPGELLWFVREQAPPFSDIAMILTLEGQNIPPHEDTVVVRTCGLSLDDPVDSAGPCTHTSIVGVDQWRVSAERYHSTPSSWKCGGTPGGTYANMTESVLTLPPLCLYSGSQMTFWHRMNAEAGTAYPYWALDAGVVEISQDKGRTWSIITPAGLYPSRASPYNTIFLAAYQRCFSGVFDWKKETFDLSSYHGPVLVRFHFASDEQYGFEGWYIDDIHVSTSVPTDAQTPPGTYANLLSPAYPNPFNPRTTIPFGLAGHARAEMKIFDASGRLVRTLLHGTYEKGPHAVVWDGTDDRGRIVASGVYFCRLKAGAYTATTRLALIR
ncbi:MAG TPA: C25 family cysteine peptidase [Candidatus Bathyarchaeia archaeon]|nr:C25 family cysteine peptidase [Candidatus Bathyarchaeia archaeon]